MHQLTNLIHKAAVLTASILVINLHSFAQLNPFVPPGSNFDLSAWKMHTLDSNYKFIEANSTQLVSGYTTKFFYTDPTDGSMVFKVPSNGQPTSTASCPRVELRQMTQGANWSLTDTTEHYLEADCKVVTVAAAKPQTIIGQIHGSDTVSQILKLRWSGISPGQCYIDAQFKTNDWAKSDYTIKLITGLSLGDLISYTITMKAGKITVNINNHITSYTYLSAYYGTTDKYYFKAGNYLQYASTDSSIYGLVKFYKLSLYHALTSVNENNDTREHTYALFQNFPNPFNPSTQLLFQIQDAGIVSLKVYDSIGNEVARLMHEFKPAGVYEVSFNAASMPGGVYFYRLQTEKYSSTKKMILLK